MKLSAFSFALAGGVFLVIGVALLTIASRLGISGAHAATNGLTAIWGPFGYAVSWLGLLMGIIISFIAGFITFGLFGIIYNSMVEK